MIAIKDIDQDVCVVKIPKKCLLESNNTEIKDLINQCNLNLIYCSFFKLIF
jgi:hypothetical protein